jgi:hypothetical protein
MLLTGRTEDMTNNQDARLIAEAPAMAEMLATVIRAAEMNHGLSRALDDLAIIARCILARIDGEEGSRR